MKLFVIYAVLVAMLITSIAQADQCSPLFNKPGRQQHSSEEIKTINESLVTLQNVAGAKIQVYRDTMTNKALVIVYDQNRAKRDKKSSENPDKVYAFSREQREEVAQAIQKLSSASSVAVVDPYLHHPSLKEKNIYGLYAIAKSELNSKLKQHSQIETSGRYKKFVTVAQQNARNTMRAIGIGMIGGLSAVILFPSEVQFGLPIFISSLGFASTTMISSFSNVLATMKHQRLDATEDILHRSFQDSERVVLILPEESRKEIQQTYDKSGIYEPLRP